MRLSLLNSDKANDVMLLFRDTFSDSEGISEGELIGNLAYEILTTTDEKDFVCFAAQDETTIAACIMFSRLSFEQGETAFLLSPVAVGTQYQRQGLGQRLIQFGLSSLKEKEVANRMLADSVKGVLTYGDPNYYSKVGFKPISESDIKAPLKLSYPDGWLGQSLTGEPIKPIAGNSRCINAFNKPEIW